ncbi:MAG: hypothetical protein JRC57_08945 [Deltaproteobacteria bacterium]|nr:hypothetical protein [Deltaproteobacteria bacterium]
MGSNKKQTRLLQKAKFEKLLAERKALLLGKGVIESKLKKDKVVKHLQIDAREKVIEEAKIKKQKNAEEKAVKPKSKKKKAETEPAEKGKGKEKKKKKKEK